MPKHGFIARCAISGLALTAATAIGVNAEAGVTGFTIDDFNSIGSPNPWPVILFEESTQTVNESGLNTLGGTRATTLSAAFDDPNGTFLQLTSFIAVGRFDYSTSANTNGMVEFVYNAGGQGLNTNFSNQIGIDLDFTIFDFGASGVLPVSVAISDGENVATSVTSATGGEEVSLFFDFVDFSGIDAVNLASVQELRVTIDAAAGADYYLHRISSVPIPAPAAIAILGVAGLLSSRRRREC